MDPAFAAMIETRERAYAERLPRTDALLATEAPTRNCAPPRTEADSTAAGPSRPMMTWRHSATPRGARAMDAHRSSNAGNQVAALPREPGA